MEVTPKAQTVELIKQANKILILTHRDPDGDALGSSLALYLALKKLQKEVDVVFQGTIGEVFSFLPAFNEAKTSLGASNDLVLTIDTRNTGEELKLGYKKLPEEKRIKIVVTPPKGSLTPEDITVERSVPKYDLIILLDLNKLDRVGPIKDQFADLFYEVPTIVIDHHADNNQFAKINWVDITATSAAEILVSLIESLSRDEPLLDADIATALLTGLITDTGSFQYRGTTPKSLTVAAQLVAAGARQQEIIECLYRTITLPRMKLWGRMLSKVQLDPTHKFIWSTLTEQDLIETGGDAGDVSGLASELSKSVDDADFALLLSDRDKIIRGNLRAIKPTCNVAEIAHHFGGGGHQAASGFRVDGAIEEKELEILNKIRAFRTGNVSEIDALPTGSSTEG
ncbi:MAG: bifunctional oligoribonuclease/PAP phosphatase NrnA [Candidatus Berkelbacteria bacterium]|nr:MAG: bifunctional oligoribonuclease/PAP phosphatase NrnA [Candidatus Berkelbacteria bacterium]QQG51743.1 MAG: bifunctional oligoribonuclease/PAP phosphatase NrnA [Candidatus Berkelbacteria bacterium]